MPNLRFNKVAASIRLCFSSAFKLWETNRAEIFLFFKSFFIIWSILVADIPVALESSIDVIRGSFSRASATSFTLRSSVAVFALPGLESLCFHIHHENG